MMQSSDFVTKLQKQQQIYKRIKLLGSGSFAKAYLVREIQTNKMFVIKQIDIADLSPDQQESARKQAKILQVLDHPNIVKFKEVYGTSKMKLNIVMEYADGGDLASKIQQAKSKSEHFSQTQILNWFTQICLAIKHIHDRQPLKLFSKIIHRDLKGQNIFLNEENCVKVGDFGVSRVLDQTMAKANTVVGSPYYLSPQIIENRPYSFKTDIWSLGAILYEMCSLNPPFTANNLQFLALKIVKGSFTKIPPKYSHELSQLIRSMLNTNPNLRPTINQILSSPIISRRIKSFLSESQNMKQFSHTVIHNKNILKKEEKEEQIKKEEQKEKLRPPPNLIELQSQSQLTYKTNKSNIQAPKSFADIPQTKAHTPYSGRKKGQLKAPTKHIKPVLNNDLSDLMKIKATPIEQPPIIKLPKLVSREYRRPETPKVVHKKQEVVYNVKKQNDTCHLFTKKRLSQQKQVIDIQEEKVQSKAVQNIPSNMIKRKQSEDVKKIVKKNDSKQNIMKKQQVKKIVERKKTKKEEKSIEKEKIQMVSEEVKKKEVEEKKKEKIVRKKFVPKQKIMKKKVSVTRAQEEKEIVEEEKFNDHDHENSNDEGNFSHYSQHSQDSLTLSQSKTLYKKNNENFNKMLKEMEMIQKIVGENGIMQNIPILGKQIPLSLNLSDEIREDDSELDSQINEKNSSELMKIQSNINLGCLTDQGQLQNLRIALEQIFGLDNILYIFKMLQQIVREKGLEFNEEQVIRMILRQKLQIDECVLRRHFRLVVTVLSIELELQELS